MKFGYKFNIIILGLFALFVRTKSSPASRVLELSDRFLDVRHEGQWLVMFYAPWCAHCKRTEPIFGLVAQALHTTSVRVGRLDCTRFPNVGHHFDIHGYPTIMFIKGHQEYVYNGDRSKDELVEYALRMSGPPVQLVTRPESIDMLKGSHTIFFMFVGQQDGIVWETYYTASERYQPHGFFYATSDELANQHFNIEKLPSIIVYKEENHYFYPHGHIAHDMEPKDVNDTIHHWVNCERFLTFPKITRFNIHQLLQTRKWIVLVVVEEDKLNQVATHELEFRDMVEELIRKYRHLYHDRFQFGWIGDPDIAHSIVMDTLPTPHLIVVNSTTQHHHIPEDDPLQMTKHSLHMFLESINNHSAPIYGGNSYGVRLYRAYFEAKKSLIEMWIGNPVLTTVLFGLPLGFLSLIMYSVFCGDCLDAPEEDEDDHEKKE